MSGGPVGLVIPLERVDEILNAVRRPQAGDPDGCGPGEPELDSELDAAGHAISLPEPEAGHQDRERRRGC
jgi:hypothetical protein